MITKSYIQDNLRQLDTAFRRTRVQKHGVYFSKLAILELCGWIEVSMDDLVLRHGARRLKLASNIKKVKKDIVARTHGFDYEDHFRAMLIKLVGIVTCENIEKCVDVAKDTRLRAQLNSLKTVRNALAHTYLKGLPATYSIDAPSLTAARFVDLYDGLKEYERVLRTL